MSTDPKLTTEDLESLVSIGHYLDGNPRDYPNRQAAMDEYRVLWLGWLAIWGHRQQTRWRRHQLESRMDELCLEISRGSGPLWQGFVKTLPGFVECMESH